MNEWGERENANQDSDREEAKAMPPQPQPPRFAQHAKETRDERGIIIGLSDFAATLSLSPSLPFFLSF